MTARPTCLIVQRYIRWYITETWIATALAKLVACRDSNSRRPARPRIKPLEESRPRITGVANRRLAKRGPATSGRSARTITSSRLTTCGLVEGGEAVRLGFVDTAGEPASIELPFDQAQCLVMTLPQMVSNALRQRTGSEEARYGSEGRASDQRIDLPGSRRNSMPSGSAFGFANDALNGAKLTTDGFPGGGFNRAINLDDPLTDRRHDCAAALPSARYGLDRGFLQGRIDLFDQEPSTPIGHANLAGRRGDRAGVSDGLQKRYFSGADPVATRQVEANAKTRIGHDDKLVQLTLCP